MPAAATPQDRRTSTKRDKDGTPSKARTPTAKELGLGNSNGVHDTAFVKNKVLQWQTLALPVTVNTEPSPGSDKERVVVAKELVEAPETPNSKDISASPAKQEDNGSDTERKKSSKDQRHNRRRRTKSPETVTEINTTVDDQTGDSSIVNFEPVTDEFAVESPTTPTLRRRGAKKTSQPTKYRYDQNTITGEDDCSSSAPSSSVDPLTIDVPSINCDLRRNDLPFKRQFPSTGKRLSTIVSVETFQSKPNLAPSFISDGSERTAQLTAIIAEDTTLESGDSRDMHYTPSFIKRKRSSGSRMASDADLISVLSIPKAGGKSIVSARSIRTNRSRLATATVDDLLAELASDEQKYMRELRTLVDGVIPVLLTCVLSKSDSAVAAGLFSRTLKDKDDPNVTKPIVDMGIALERLKSLHKRIPTSDVDALLSWAQTAQRSYNDYLKAWRLGFQDVVISLAPASEDNVSKDSETGAWDAGLPRNEHGDILDSLGERVDVAYLLKRPLVRLKFLSKTFRGINFIRYSSKAEAVSNEYQALFLAARQRQDDERARLEDDAAANIDTTRARDPKSLAPVQGVLIDPFRHVKARDPFDLHILHSSGQEIDCRVELVLRDDAPDRGSSGDVLLCEVGDKGRCLFFPPIQLSRISARAGNSNYELVAMIRGLHSAGQEWHELLTLKSNDDQTVMDWIKMLGSNPVPPRLTRAQSFMNKKIRPKSKQGDSLAIVTSSPTTSMKSRTPSPREVQVPIGEPAQSTAKTWGTETPEKDDIRRRSMDVSPTSPQSQETPRYDGEEYGIADSPPSPIEPLSRDDKTQHRRSSRRTSRPDSGTVSTPRSLNEAMMLAGTGSPTTLKRTRARRYRNTPSPTSGSLRGSNDHTPVKDHEDRVKSKPMMPRQDRADSAPPSTTGFSTIGSSVTGSSTTGSSTLSSGKSYSVWFPPSDVENDEEEQEGDDEDVTPRKPVRPQPHRRTSTVPSLDLPTIPKLRKTSQPITPVNESSSAHKELDFVQKRPLKDTPMSAPPKLQKSIESSKTPIKKEDKPPVPPPHRPSNAGELKSSNTPQFTPAWKQHRRSSSPLKHEYEPSTATETSASEESDESFYENDYSTTSESSEDDIEEDVSILGPLPPIQPRKVSPPNSLYTLGNGTLSPSQSASQSPYRTVPANSGKMTKAIACIFSWSDKGMWEQLHPEECSIVITPGLIEAFEMGANHSKPPPSQETGTDTKPERPLVAVELTPLVPLRRGTALDISIRSPPTSNSKLASSSNIMFRSRSPEECEALYQLINQSRINNITYIALQNARGSYAENTWGATMDRRNATRSTSGSTGSWWGTLSRSRSYRASSHRAASTTAASDSSVGTMQTAFSALRRFTSGGIFNVARSTITSREGSRSIGSGDSMFSGGSGSGSASGTSTPRASTSANAPPPMPLGITNTKIRLYVRESGNKWRDMGSARLSILMPSTSTPSRTAGAVVPGSPGTNSQGQKRIVVLGKTKGETLLDVTLGESSFERVARTGIAVSVWEDCMGPEGIVGTVGKTGGVSGARARVYMIQTKTEREAAYSFSLLGKLRY
ncbi:hypothetical protein M501DRAFT_924699 [Patellaria atrata CBS 101060]|uniref:Uncharacterized protein n=1 Tax=Patellaria atrata CBS 101060 TaxID=1346257 RepID=A0A9P4SK57_9PEZI|nr:hypothetical protein M501DRAFT_924699 [Patellaria atrata CBS 101060]